MRRAARPVRLQARLLRRAVRGAAAARLPAAASCRGRLPIAPPTPTSPLWQVLTPQECNDPRPRCTNNHNCHEWTRLVSRCAGGCDVTSNRCLCGPRARYPERPMFMCEWRGINRVINWRSPGWAHFTLMEPYAEIWPRYGRADFPLGTRRNHHIPNLAGTRCGLRPTRRRPTLRRNSAGRYSSGCGQPSAKFGEVVHRHSAKLTCGLTRVRWAKSRPSNLAAADAQLAWCDLPPHLGEECNHLLHRVTTFSMR